MNILAISSESPKTCVTPPQSCFSARVQNRSGGASEEPVVNSTMTVFDCRDKRASSMSCRFEILSVARSWT